MIVPNKTRALLKAAFAIPAAYTGEEQQQSSGGGIPWGSLALAGLLAGGAAYGYGKYNPNSFAGGFASGVDQNVLSPVKNMFQSFTTNADQEAQRIHQRANNAGFLKMLNGVKTPSQLQGTDYYEPGNLETGANVMGLASGLGAGAGAAAQGLRQARVMALRNAPSLGLQAGKGMLKSNTMLGGGMRFLGRHANPLHAVTTVGDGMQLGDKLNDSMGIQNKFARGAIQTGTVGAGVGSTFAGARLGSRFGPWGALAGGTIGSLAPGLVNGALNQRNNHKLLTNQMSGRAASLQTDFEKALHANKQGNPNILQGWYKSQGSPAQLNMTIGQYSNNPGLQRQMMLNNPNQRL